MHVVLAEGVSALSYGRVAKELAISDRMVVYYFPAKADLISAVIVAIGGELQLMLEEAFGSEPLSAKELMCRAWPVLSVKKAQPMFNGFFEVIGLASAGQSPYDELAPVLLNGWIDWLADRVKAQSSARRREIAASVVAQASPSLKRVGRRLCVSGWQAGHGRPKPCAAGPAQPRRGHLAPPAGRTRTARAAGCGPVCDGHPRSI